jgi:DNA-directed RNA polymerase specialized sigma24 family protein
LTELQTNWVQLYQAQEGHGPTVRQARGELAKRYLGAVRRYLLDLLPQAPHVAEEIASNFALGILEGATFLQYAGRKEGATTRAGSFRAYLKKVLRNKIHDYYRQTNARGRNQVPGFDLDNLRAGASDPASVPDGLEAGLRAELLDRAWKGLLREEQSTGQPYYRVLRLQSEDGEQGLTGAQLATRLQALLGRPFTFSHVRQLLRRSRLFFARRVVQEVANSLRNSPADPVEPAAVEQELIDLGLLNAYVRQALEEHAKEA